VKEQPIFLDARNPVFMLDEKILREMSKIGMNLAYKIFVNL